MVIHVETLQVSVQPLFSSKLLEKVVASRLDDHITLNNLHDEYQSAYRPLHSTETALMKVQSDICEALDDGSMVVLLMLDLSAAFDTLDHNTMLSRFRSSFGITGQALDWLKSYITNRHQCVAVGSATSEDSVLQYGVPQGSVLGPRMYCMYTKPVGSIVRSHNLSHHSYADDTQAYLVIKPINVWPDVATTLEACMSDISRWMRSNCLKLNEDKFEIYRLPFQVASSLFS